MFLYGLLTMTGAEINIHCHAYPEQFIPYDADLQAFGGIIFSEAGAIEAEDSSIMIDLDAEKGEKDYAYNYFGVLDAGDQGSITLNHSEIGVRLDSQNVTDANGIYLQGNMILENESKLTCDMHNRGVVRGFAGEGRLTISNSDTDVSVSSYSGEETYGILCNSAEMDLDDTKYSIVSKAAGGMAFAANTGRQDKKAKKYDASYKMTRFKFMDDTMCLVPDDSAISLASVPGSMEYIRVETFYDKADTAKPAEEVRISKGDKPDNTLAVKGRTVKVSAKKLKKKSQTITSKKAMTVTGARGIVTYSKVSVDRKKYAKKFTVNNKTGNITVKKGLKKGIYHLTIEVKAAGNEKYKPACKNATVTIKVK
jgi:hypothetical protein